MTKLTRRATWIAGMCLLFTLSAAPVFAKPQPSSDQSTDLSTTKKKSKKAKKDAAAADDKAAASDTSSTKSKSKKKAAADAGTSADTSDHGEEEQQKEQEPGCGRRKPGSECRYVHRNDQEEPEEADRGHGGCCGTGSRS